jgi:predicted house-cleaning NTP pyrophosphatase (Maf/HAM1 superfamily)
MTALVPEDDVLITADILKIEDFRLKKKPRPEYTSCKHLHLIRDDELHTVECADCGVQIGAYAAFKMIIDRWVTLKRRVDSEARIAREATEKTVVLRAAQKVEKAWRSLKLVPTCPHCDEAIFATDNFGGSAMNKEVALQRRAVEKSKLEKK